MDKLTAIKEAKLIKDFADGRIFYFWEFQTGEAASDSLTSYEDAVEWWRHAVFDAYEGPERRTSYVDRRANDVARVLQTPRGQLPPMQSHGGRRATDKLPEIAEDRSIEKIKAFKMAFIKSKAE